MKNFKPLVFAVASAAALHLQAGEVTGTITLKGSPPPEKDITPLKEDANCGKLHSTMPKTHFYVLGANNGLADVVVSLQGTSGKSTGAAAPGVVIDQKGCEYIPSILAVQTGQKITVKTSDPVMHNVHTQPATPGNKDMNQVQMAGGPDLVVTFDKPEEFLKFKCDVHPWMFAWVTVFDHPYFALSDKDGTFKIANVPAGKYTLVASHRKAGKVTQEIEVKDGAPATVNLALDAK
jgi:plastocyanin